MGIFSFGKKDDASNRRGANSSSKRGSNGGDRSERVERRSRRAERAGDADAMLLDPTLPEKQRARRRLVGAIALVVAAVVILPMVLDSHPKPVTDDISIDIPSRPVSRARTQDPQDTQAGVAPDNPAAPDAAPGAAEGTQSASGVSPAPTATAATGSLSRDAAPKGAASAQPAQSAGKSQQGAVTATNTAPAAAKPAQTATANTTAPAKSSPAATQSAEAATNTTQGATAAQADSGTPAAPPGSRFAVQLGSFSDDASARNWVNKLKAAGVPAYIEKRKQADGSVRTLLRAGPFADRAAASAAIAKVREAGLTSGANNGSAQ
ncbi:SPOR domain-containing protein [Paraburkholderia humisilvae]|uniref:Cell division protein DedD n=1 Tax=Paraburkholderia humisilvae TaxID=627669 RepID=A0A6J5EY32_9BURK|nr:SPOR domain-containing protein [Paraburkholderia humisilvae]CAB3770321.1 Cell division protein DedD [Paraburkholderia humisilvae]